MKFSIGLLLIFCGVAIGSADQYNSQSNSGSLESVENSKEDARSATVFSEVSIFKIANRLVRVPKENRHLADEILNSAKHNFKECEEQYKQHHIVNRYKNCVAHSLRLGLSQAHTLMMMNSSSSAGRRTGGTSQSDEEQNNRS